MKKAKQTKPGKFKYTLPRHGNIIFDEFMLVNNRIKPHKRWDKGKYNFLCETRTVTGRTVNFLVGVQTAESFAPNLHNREMKLLKAFTQCALANYAVYAGKRDIGGTRRPSQVVEDYREIVRDLLDSAA